MAKRNPQDSTLRNVRAQKVRLIRLEQKVRKQAAAIREAVSTAKTLTRRLTSVERSLNSARK